VQDQLKDGSREVQLGELAQKNAASADVKEFARMMVQDHTRAGKKLEEVAQRENVEREDKSDNDARDDVQKLSKLSGRDFDKEYIDMMVKDHKDAVDALQDQAENADHADVKTWAAETLPRIKHHLEVAQQLQNQLNNAAETSAKSGSPKKNRG
jgi:putative membrane protein